MPQSPQALHLLQGVQRRRRADPQRMPHLVVAGAAGALGNEVLRRLGGSLRYGHVSVLAREPIRAGMARIDLTCMPATPPDQWPTVQADVGVVMFEAPRLFYERERALWIPQPQQLEALAAWMRRGGVHTVAVVMPHARGALPEALAGGFVSLSEQVISSMGFETVVWIRSANDVAEPRPRTWLLRARALVLSVFSYMIPPSQQVIRAAQMAQVVSQALEHAPAGVHVLSHERVWQALRAGSPAMASDWFAKR
jgi:hypothetical protein